MIVINLNKIKIFLKKNKFIDGLLRIIFYPYFNFKLHKSNKEMQRRNKQNDKNYSWIKDLHNSHKDETCFIVATGPSLKIEDLDHLYEHNAYCFGMNSLIKAFNETKWRPNMYCIQDEYVFEKLKDDIFKCETLEIIVSNNIDKKFKLMNRYKKFFINNLDHNMFHVRGYGKFKFSDDCYCGIYDGYSITFSILQLAVYMGFKNIYLLGCDCNYNQRKHHFIDSGHKDPKAKIMGDKMIVGHRHFYEFAKSKKINVVNCTRGGMLEVYPRENLDDVIRRCDYEKNSNCSNEIK